MLSVYSDSGLHHDRRTVFELGSPRFYSLLPLLMPCVTLGHLLHLSEPQATDLKNEGAYSHLEDLFWGHGSWHIVDPQCVWLAFAGHCYR